MTILPVDGCLKQCVAIFPVLGPSGVERYNKRWISILTDPELAQVLSGRAAVQLKVSNSSMLTQGDPGVCETCSLPAHGTPHASCKCLPTGIYTTISCARYVNMQRAG